MLTREDYDVLIDAMSAWERKGAGRHLVKTLAGTLACKTPDDVDRLFQAGSKEAERIKNARRERSTLLKAKLIQMRNSQET